jgi:hypothetical protein
LKVHKGNDENGEVLESYTLSEYKTSAEMHALFSKVGIVKLSTEEVEAKLNAIREKEAEEEGIRTEEMLERKKKADNRKRAYEASRKAEERGKLAREESEAKKRLEKELKLKADL